MKWDYKKYTKQHLITEVLTEVVCRLFLLKMVKKGVNNREKSECWDKRVWSMIGNLCAA